MPLKNISVDVQALEGHWQEVAFKLGDKVCSLWRLAFFRPGPGQKQASKNPVCLSARRLQCPFWAVPVGMPAAFIVIGLPVLPGVTRTNQQSAGHNAKRASYCSTEPKFVVTGTNLHT